MQTKRIAEEEAIASRKTVTSVKENAKVTENVATTAKATTETTSKEPTTSKETYPTFAELEALDVGDTGMVAEYAPDIFEYLAELEVSLFFNSC